MERAELLAELMKLPVEDRLEIAQNLWVSAEPGEELPALTDEQKAILERRRSEFVANPSSRRPWDQVKARILAKLDKDFPAALQAQS